MLHKFYLSFAYGSLQGFLSGKQGAGTHKSGKHKCNESFVKICLYNNTVYLNILLKWVSNLETEL